jgi:hypothetical protein
MSGMLTKNPLSRLCKFSQIKSHTWFTGFTWENLISLDVEVPFVPKITNKEVDESKVMPYSNYIKVKLIYLEYEGIYF